MLKYHGDTSWNKIKSARRPLQLTYSGYVYFHVFRCEFSAHSSKPHTQQNESQIQSQGKASKNFSEENRYSLVALDPCQ